VMPNIDSFCIFFYDYLLLFDGNRHRRWDAGDRIRASNKEFNIKLNVFDIELCFYCLRLSTTFISFFRCSTN
jgi:hypothetical protein